MTRKPIPKEHVSGIEGYEADDQGNIYNPAGKKLKPTPVKGGTSKAGGGTSTGHDKVHITGGTGDSWPYVSRLVAAAFGEDIEGRVVRHNDDQKNGTNNKRKNLKSGTRAENAADRKRIRGEMADKIVGKDK